MQDGTLIVNLEATWLSASLQRITHSQELPRAILSVLDDIVLAFCQEIFVVQSHVKNFGCRARASTQPNRARTTSL
jgi:hypothetical protein